MGEAAYLAWLVEMYKHFKNKQENLKVFFFFTAGMFRQYLPGTAVQ